MLSLRLDEMVNQRDKASTFLSVMLQIITSNLCTCILVLLLLYDY